ARTWRRRCAGCWRCRGRCWRRCRSITASARSAGSRRCAASSPGSYRPSRRSVSRHGWGRVRFSYASRMIDRCGDGHIGRARRPAELVRSGNVYDQASRYLLQLDVAILLLWLLGLVADEVEFDDWLNTGNIPWPGQPDRTCDTVAYLRDLTDG